MIHLRDYQEDLLDGVQAELAPEEARVMMQLPTGGGKTVIAGAFLKEWLKGGRKAVWLTHRKELAAQTCDMLASANVAATVDTYWNSGDDAPARPNGVAILMAQTVSRRTARMDVWRNYDRDDLMIVDEAHHAAAVGWTRAMRQWPGRVLGMTATPWRLSEKEGFDHLFSSLICGPQVLKLQSGNHLCDAQVRMPSSEWVIQGGAVGMTGDFTDSGIEAANQNNIMTAGALKFWQEHALDRQTIVYAVSVNHAHNLAAVFRDAGVPSAVILGETEGEDRASLISAFKYGMLKVLVNVAVATEGFDLPDASCIVITRPTKSLTLYLQMVGRGLRPKENGGNCLILDLAANSEFHGLPAEDREWSLEPREAQDSEGDALTIWCGKCETLSPAASHNCQNCDAPFGKDCKRCGTWRAWRRWSLEKLCGDAHDLVCNLCHRDAHIEAHLPIDEQLETALAELEEKDEEMLSRDQDAQHFDHVHRSLGKYHDFLRVLSEEFGSDLAYDFDNIQHSIDSFESDLEAIREEFGPGPIECIGRWRLYWLLRQQLEAERKNIVGANEKRQYDLQESIKVREAHLVDESSLDTKFENHLKSLPIDERPQNNPQKYRMFTEWENDLRNDLREWRKEIARLEDEPVDRRRIFERVAHTTIEILCQAAQDTDLLPDVFEIGSGEDNGPPQSQSGSNVRERVSRKRLSANRRGSGKARKEASVIAKRIKAAGGSYADIEKELAAGGFKNTKGKPYAGVSAIYSLLNK